MDTFDTLFIPQQHFPTFEYRDSRKDEGKNEKKKNLPITFEMILRNLIRIVHVEIEGFFESVARSFQSLHRGSVGRFDERQEFCGVQRGGL